MSRIRVDWCVCGEEPHFEKTKYGWIVWCPNCGNRSSVAHKTKRAASDGWFEEQRFRREHCGMDYKQWLDKLKWMGESRDKAEAAG